MKISIGHTFHLGPLNLTVSKSGLTASVGVPGARVFANTKGEVGTRLGFKGFSYTKKKKVL